MKAATNRLLSAWRAVLEADPAARALIDGRTGEIVTRGGLQRQVDAERAALPPEIADRRVVFAEPNSVRWLARFLALLEAGAVPVLLDPTEPAARQHEIASELRAAGLWAAGESLVVSRAVAPVRDRSATLIKLTSGSTGRPQPLRFTAEQMLADGEQVCASMGIDPGDLNLAVIPFGHSYGLGNLVLPLLARGTAIVLAEAAHPRVLVETCARWSCTVFPTVPALLRLLVDAEVNAEGLASLRTVISAGSPLPAATAQAFAAKFHRRVHGFYGSSETGGITYDRNGDATLAGRSVGTPLEGVRLTLGRAGRITVESAAVFTLGNRQRRSRSTGRHRPADRGELNALGELVLTGRVGRLAKIAGRRIDLSEIEAALRTLPGVSEAFVLPHPTKAEQLAAAVQTEQDQRALRNALAARLPAWKVPRRLVCLPRFPITARGKPDTAALRRLLGAEAPT